MKSFAIALILWLSIKGNCVVLTDENMNQNIDIVVSLTSTFNLLVYLTILSPIIYYVQSDPLELFKYVSVQVHYAVFIVIYMIGGIYYIFISNAIYKIVAYYTEHYLFDTNEKVPLSIYTNPWAQISKFAPYEYNSKIEIMYADFEPIKRPIKETVIDKKTVQNDTDIQNDIQAYTCEDGSYELFSWSFQKTSLLNNNFS
ncbi:hypothetical protein A3Q56_01747 [Intoshia linei]|uniref:Uncharacterized protein n=1 Tax=Intoshia linei TaxID=1819745 RepID=A0A177BA30_9BILA|nr:hypothetical protein A3Q56_01747 [Intoshia linei]